MKNFPDIKDIKLLEKNSQKNGSGIAYEELLGICLLYTSDAADEE